MTIITINNNVRAFFNNFGSAIDFLNNEAKNDSWNKLFVVHSAPTMDDVNGYEDLVHEVNRINRVFNAKVKMAY